MAGKPGTSKEVWLITGTTSSNYRQRNPQPTVSVFKLLPPLSFLPCEFHNHPGPEFPAQDLVNRVLCAPHIPDAPTGQEVFAEAATLQHARDERDRGH